MFGPKRTVLLTRNPVPNNKFPARRFPSLGLGGEAKSVSFLLPLLFNSSATKIPQKMSIPVRGGRSFDLIDEKVSKRPVGHSMAGSGKNTEIAEEDSVEQAFLHPIKVLRKFAQTSPLLCLRRFRLLSLRR